MKRMQIVVNLQGNQRSNFFDLGKVLNRLFNP